MCTFSAPTQNLLRIHLHFWVHSGALAGTLRGPIYGPLLGTLLGTIIVPTMLARDHVKGGLLMFSYYGVFGT